MTLSLRLLEHPVEGLHTMEWKGNCTPAQDLVHIPIRFPVRNAGLNKLWKWRVFFWLTLEEYAGKIVTGEVFVLPRK